MIVELLALYCSVNVAQVPIRLSVHVWQIQGFGHVKGSTRLFKGSEAAPRTDKLNL